MLELLNNPIVIEGIVALIGAVYSYLKIKGKINEDWQKILEESVKIGVTKIYQDEVRDLKKNLAGSKLTSDQAKDIRSKAINIAAKYAADRGKDILNKFGLDAINVLVEETVSKLKK